MLTTAIGAYPKPAGMPIRDWFRQDGGTDRAEPRAGYAETVRQHGGRLEGILDRATTQMVREQVELGIDIPTDGAVRREDFVCGRQAQGAERGGVQPLIEGGKI